MAAFDFPSPPVADGTEVTNDATGVTYRYDASVDSWTIISTEIAIDVNDQISTLNAEIVRIDGEIATALSERDGLIENAIDTNDAQDARLDALESVDYATSTELQFETAARTLADGNLQSQIDELETAVDNIDVGDIDLSGYYTSTEVDTLVGTKADTTYVDAADAHLQLQVDELLTTKGAASVYTLNDIGIIVGIRPGDFYIDNTVAKNVRFITLAPVDDNGNERPIGAVGDILELVKSDNTTYRYEITTAGEGVAGVEFQVAADPDDLLIPGMTFSVYIYPQNTASASIEYVDTRHEEAKTYADSVVDGYLPLAGGEMTGDLHMNDGTISTNALVKSTRTSGYAFQVYDEGNDTNLAFLHSNGNIRGAQGVFTDTLEVRNTALFKKTTTFEQNISVTNSVNCNGGWISGNWGFERNTKGLRWYSDDRSDHLADITWQTDKLETLMYDDYLWTLKVQNSGNTDSNVLIYADYSSGLVLNEVNEININGNINSNGHFFTKGGSFRIDKADGNKQFQIYPNGSDYGATIYTYNNGYFRVRIAEGDTQSPYKEFITCQAAEHTVGGATHPVSTTIKWLITPTVNHHAANKQYVDDMGQIYYGSIVPAGSDVNDGDLWVDSGNMRLLMRASGAWVNPDREADTDSFKANATPNGRKFAFSSGTAAVTGKLNYYDSGGLKLRLSNTDAFGITWNDGGITEDITMSNGPYFTITEVVNDTNHKIIRQGRVSRIDYHSGDILCHLSSHRTNGSFSTSKEYWVNIGGII